jgi:hypothetical protein
MPTVLVSTGLLNVTLIVPPQKPTGFPVESTVGHSDRRTPTAPSAGLIETIANGPGFGLVDCEPQPKVKIARRLTVIASLFSMAGNFGT